MAQTHKPPRTIRLSDFNKGLAEKAARLESKRLGRTVGWSTIVTAGGMAKVRRILKRAEKAKEVA